MQPPKRKATLEALRNAAIYGVFGFIWIGWSDEFLATWIKDVATLTQFQSYKGWLYVAITSVVVYILVKYSLNQRIANEEALRKERDLNQSYLDTVQTIMLALDCAGRITMINRAGSELLGYREKELLGQSWFEQCLPADNRERVFAIFEQAMAGSITDSHYVENEILCRDGELRLIAWYNTYLLDDQGRMNGILSSGQDVTVHREMDRQLRIAAIAFESQEGIFVTDDKGNILRVNHAFTQITGYEAKDVVGKNPRMLSSGRHDEKFYSLLWHTLNATDRWEGEIWNRRKNGEVYPENLLITAVRDASNIVTHYVAVLADITLRKQSEEKIKQLAFYDPLTQLPNRRLLLDRLHQAMLLSARKGSFGALIFIDLDNFKLLNDSLGHSIGDLLLQQIAHRLHDCFREGDTMARLGGDEFVVVLEALDHDPEQAADIAKKVGEKILEVLARPFRLQESDYHCSASLGVTLFEGEKHGIDDLLKQADMAMYKAKSKGRNQICFYDTQMQERINARAFLEVEMHKAIERGEFQLYFQPQVDENGIAWGAEALIRWLHPERGLISPAEFIPLAEETGMILKLGDWVIETACRQLKSWQQNVKTQHLLLAVNVSARQFHQLEFVTNLKQTLVRHSIRADLLKLELTESLLLQGVDSAVAKMAELHKLGVKFSLDDFGTGYSSLQYLKRLPLTQLKIDQSFVRDIVQDKSDKAIVAAVIAMAVHLGINVIAEGVETQEQHQLLRELGCWHFQGYLFGRPCPIAEFETLLHLTSTPKSGD